MAENTAIEWADHTFNPWTGCTKVSPACDHCYAESWAKRSGTVRWGHGEPRRRTTDANWRLPIKWNAQAQREGRRFRVFCASLADVFDNEVPVQWRVDLFRLIASTPHLDWLLLTKRIGNWRKRMEESFGQITNPELATWVSRWLNGFPPSNVWLGATVIDQTEADRDVPKLLATPARVRFLSIEPMLGPVDLGRFIGACERPEDDPQPIEHCERCGCVWNRDEPHECPPGFGPRPDWVICGGESGPHARPMHPDWARSLAEQCRAAGVAFFMKQMGGTRDKRGALEDLPADLRVREFPHAA